MSAVENRRKLRKGDCMIDTVVKYLKENNVPCKKVEDGRENYGDFIAIFGYGNLARQDIAKQIADNNLSCMFFEGSIRENEYKIQIKKPQRNGHS